MYAQFDAIVCISKGVKASLVKWLPAVNEKCYVVYNGTKILDSNEFNLNDDNSKLLSVGRLVEPKNYVQTLEILSPMIKDLNLTYTIAGEGIWRAVIENTIKDLKIQPKVKLLGRISDVTQEYKAHNLFLILSRWEGFGLACVEALSYGLRIIASDVQGMREILIPLIGKGVLLVSLNDSNENIRNQIQAFILQPDTKANFDLRKQRAKDFDINITAKGYTQVYKSLNRA
jgi:glycosyltransferase involved in cell wall biosynthesis